MNHISYVSLHVRGFISGKFSLPLHYRQLQVKELAKVVVIDIFLGHWCLNKRQQLVNIRLTVFYQLSHGGTTSQACLYNSRAQTLKNYNVLSQPLETFESI